MVTTSPLLEPFDHFENPPLIILIWRFVETISLRFFKVEALNDEELDWFNVTDT